MALQAKGLAFKEIEVTPGFGQVAIFRLSGQRQVPVLVDGDSVIADSSSIIHYLETRNPIKPLIPDDRQAATQVHLIEDWADTTLANATKTALLQATAIDKDLRSALIPEELPTALRMAIGQMPYEFISDIKGFLSKGERDQLLDSLQKLSSLLENRPWIVGNSMTVADLAVAAQISLLYFPQSSGNHLAGKGVPGISDHPRLKSLFEWRDQLETSLMAMQSIN